MVVNETGKMYRPTHDWFLVGSARTRSINVRSDRPIVHCLGDTQAHQI